MEIDMTHDFTVYLVNTILKTILGFLILDIKIQEIFQSMKIIGTEYHKIAMTQNIVITKGKQKTISECPITFCKVLILIT